MFTRIRRVREVLFHTHRWRTLQRRIVMEDWPRQSYTLEKEACECGKVREIMRKKTLDQWVKEVNVSPR